MEIIMVIKYKLVMVGIVLLLISFLQGCQTPSNGFYKYGSDVEIIREYSKDGYYKGKSERRDNDIRYYDKKGNFIGSGRIQ
jgi:hypothetical protein